MQLPSWNKSTGRPITRRNVLKSAGLSAVTVVGSGSVVSAATPNDTDGHYQRAIELRNRSGNHQVFLRYLRNHDFEVQTKHFETEISRGGGDISAQYDDPATNSSGFSVDISLSNHCSLDNRMFIDYYWTFHNVDARDDGDATATHRGYDPYDAAGIYWSSTDYSRVTNTEYSDSYALVGGAYGDYNSNGIAWEYQDRKHYLDKQEANNYHYTGDISSYAGCQVSRESPEDPAYTRSVQIDYIHTFNSCSFTGVSVGTGGVSLQGGCDTDTWDYTAEKGEQEVTFIC